jgi:simple sugar transport system permease protein
VVLLLALLLALGGFDVGMALRALLRGAAASPAVFASATLVRATPIILAGLAVALAFRAGILNVGADGQLLGGAAAAAAVALAVGDSAGRLGILPVLMAGLVAGALCASGPAWLRRRFGVLEVITTIMVNFIVVNGVSWLVRGPLQEPTRVLPQSAAIVPVLELPIVAPGTRLHAGFLLAVVVAVALHAYLGRTAGGFRVRVLGANAAAAAAAGLVNTGRLSTRVFLASGALAGLAGAVQVAGVTRALYDNLSPGYGFTAIAVALLAGLHPLGILLSGTFLGGLSAGAASMQRDAGVPAVLVSVLEAAVILSVVVWRAHQARRPLAPAGGESHE